MTLPSLSIAALLTAALLIIAGLSGCANTTVTQNPDGTFTTNAVSTAERVGRAAEAAGWNAVVLTGPKERPYFEAAVKELDILLGRPAFTLGDLIGVLQRAGIHELNSREARLVIGNARILFQDQLALTPPADVTKFLRTVGERLRAGVRQGLVDTRP